MKRALLLLVLLAACKKERQLSGVENWNVNHTTLDDATGRCTPDGDGMYCFGQKPMGIRGMAAEIDLYFAGQKPDSQLSEIQLKIGACDDQELYGWMQTNFGRPVEDKGSRHMGRNSFLWAVGEMPLADGSGQCIVRLIPRREEARFERAWGGSK